MMTRTAKIIETEPSTEYEGVVYDQKVIVELEDGTTIGLFDPELMVDPEATGEKRDILISVLTSPSKLKRIPDGEYDVKPPDDQPLFWQNHVYRGGVIDLSPESEFTTITVDFGVGELTTRLRTDEIPGLSIGEFVQIDAVRSDIDDII